MDTPSLSARLASPTASALTNRQTDARNTAAAVAGAVVALVVLAALLALALFFAMRHYRRALRRQQLVVKQVQSVEVFHDGASASFHPFPRMNTIDDPGLAGHTRGSEESDASAQRQTSDPLPHGPLGLGARSLSV